MSIITVVGITMYYFTSWIALDTVDELVAQDQRLCLDLCISFHFSMLE